MRKIAKTHAPAVYRHWVRDNAAGPGNSYAAMPGPVKQCLKDRLLEEQGFLCAYTGLEIHDATSHVEHLKPQSRCRRGEDVDYRNLVACFPKDGGDTSYGYGAPVKGSWWDAALFVSPLSVECGQRFSFAWSGHVRAFPDGHQAATETIDRLGLDRPALCKLRRQAIDSFFGFSSANPITETDARRLLQEIEKPNAEGRLRSFCFLLRQMLERYLSNTGAHRG